MTDDHVQPPASDQHLDDEVLVALLDGEGTPEEEAAAGAHLPGCGRCTERREELAGTLGLAAAPVAALPPWLQDVQIRRALMAAPAVAEPEEPPDAGVAPPRPLMPIRPPRRPWPAVTARAAAVLVVVAALGAGVYGASRLGTSGSGGGSASGTNTRLPEAVDGLHPVAWLRPVAGEPPRSCPSLNQPASPGGHDPLPNAIVPVPHGSPSSECLLVGPVAVYVPPEARVVLSGPPGLAGPDTLTFSLPPDLVPPGLLGSPPPGPELVMQADGAAVGVVRSASRRGGVVDVVVGNVTPAVAEYLKGLFAGAGGH